MRTKGRTWGHRWGQDCAGPWGARCLLSVSENFHSRPPSRAGDGGERGRQALNPLGPMLLLEGTGAPPQNWVVLGVWGSDPRGIPRERSFQRGGAAGGGRGYSKMGEGLEASTEGVGSRWSPPHTGAPAGRGGSEPGTGRTGVDAAAQVRAGAEAAFPVSLPTPKATPHPMKNSLFSTQSPRHVGNVPPRIPTRTHHPRSHSKNIWPISPDPRRPPPHLH